MATIEERAKDFANKGLPNNIEGAIRYTYMYAANEQQKIDIDKACYFIKRNTMFNNCVNVNAIAEQLRKAMEE